ncbi:MAG: class I SAM-dependent methyltransferase [Chloroflexi bacterium]|nr:class I SAM-dependent methyltransferase [Chloroflexota bacterium]
MAQDHADAIRRYYETDRNLRIHEETQAKYSVPRVDFVRWTLDTIDWTGNEVILDIGAGRGGHYARLMQEQPDITYFALDLSPSLLRCHPCAADRLALGDAMRLPFHSDSFDIVMANHVLYHLADVDAGLAEIKRVLKPDGRVLAATDSLHNIPQLQMLIHRANVFLSDNGVKVKPPTLPCDAFALENGTRILARHFFAVVRHDLPCQLKFDDIEPAMEYLESMRDLRQGGLPEDVDWEHMMMVVRRDMTQLLQLGGSLDIDLAVGALVASDCGGFIGDFVRRNHA